MRVRDALLVLNAGSSSLKFSVFLDGDEPRLHLRGQVSGLPDRPRFEARDAERVVGEKKWDAGTRLEHAGAFEFLLGWGRGGPMGEHLVAATGHRVVHGGTAFAAPVRLDAAAVEALEAMVPLAPLHLPHHVAAIRAVLRVAPEMPHVACFDTSFHRSQPPVAQAIALPRRFADEGVRRYGFHGLSYEYVASVLPRIDERAAHGRTVCLHLGNGASMCALRDCASVATTMSFTALDGLVMGTRSGAVDPGVLLYLMDRHGMGARELEALLYGQSGLLGVSGVSSDMRALLASDDPRAAEAVDLFVYRIGRELGSLAAALGGLDAVVFTGGIGENSAAIRARVCRDAAWLGVELDGAANAAGARRISTPGSRTSAWVVPTNEELMIALHVRRLIGPSVG